MELMILTALWKVPSAENNNVQEKHLYTWSCLQQQNPLPASREISGWQCSAHTLERPLQGTPTCAVVFQAAFGLPAHTTICCNLTPEQKEYSWGPSAEASQLQVTDVRHGWGKPGTKTYRYLLHLLLFWHQGTHFCSSAKGTEEEELWFTAQY